MIAEWFFGAGETRHFTNGWGLQKKEEHYDDNADSPVLQNESWAIPWMWEGGTNVGDKGGGAISSNVGGMKKNYATVQILDSSTWDAVDKNYNTHLGPHTYTPRHAHIHLIRHAATRFSPCCKPNVNVFQTLRYIRAIRGTVLSTTMVCREQPSRDQCSLSWISEGDILL